MCNTSIHSFIGSATVVLVFLSVKHMLFCVVFVHQLPVLEMFHYNVTCERDV